MFVDTQGWISVDVCEGNDNCQVEIDAGGDEPLSQGATLANILEATDYIFTCFRELLDKLGVGLLLVQEELEEVFLYS